MLSPFKTVYQWRRVAVFQPFYVPVRLPGEEKADEAAASGAGYVGMRVALCLDAETPESNSVALVLGEGIQFGHLPADVAEWVAPLLKSGKHAFDAEICSIDKVRSKKGNEALRCQLLLTQHELVPVKRLSLTAWLFGRRQSRSTTPVR